MSKQIYSRDELASLLGSSRAVDYALADYWLHGTIPEGREDLDWEQISTYYHVSERSLAICIDRLTRAIQNGRGHE